MKNLKITTAAIVAVALAATPALAHHPLGGRAPGNLVEGLMSGIAHPVIGVDHLVMVVAIGLLAAVKRQGWWMPIAFALTAMVGTGLHLQSVPLPGTELWVALSVMVLGGLMLWQKRLNLATIVGFGGLAGLAHGYAYGEAIFGAEATPLVAYLLGFTAVQLAIALSAMQVAKMTLADRSDWFRVAALVTIGAGVALVVGQSIA